MMNTTFKKSQAIVCALITGTALMCAVTATAMAEPNWDAHDKPANHEQMREHFREHLKARLDRLAARLEIKASQEPAWETYTNAVEGLMTHPEHKADMKNETEEDAAAMIHHRAEHAAEKAKKLAELADATDKLQAALNENQRKLFNHEVSRQMEHMRHMRHMGRFMERHGDGCSEHEEQGHAWH